MIKKIKLGSWCQYNQPVEIEIRPITILIGESGAGKSTLLNFLWSLRQGKSVDSAKYELECGDMLKDKKRLHFKSGQLPESYKMQMQQLQCIKSGRVDFLHSDLRYCLQDKTSKNNLSDRLNSWAIEGLQLEFAIEASNEICIARRFNPDVAEQTALGLPWHLLSSGERQYTSICCRALTAQPGDQILWEHPETNLHPNLQLKLGQLLEEFWHLRQVLSIVETHSSNLLLRLRKLVRVRQLSSSEVSVVYCYVDKSGQYRVSNHEIDSYGRLTPSTIPMELAPVAIPTELLGADLDEWIEIDKRP